MSEILRASLLLLAMIGGVKPAMAQSASSAPGVMLQSAIEKEEVDGDLKAAMAIYEKIASDTSVPCDVRAKALLRLEGREEKLGVGATSYSVATGGRFWQWMVLPKKTICGNSRVSPNSK